MPTVLCVCVGVCLFIEIFLWKMRFFVFWYTFFPRKYSSNPNTTYCGLLFDWCCINSVKNDQQTVHKSRMKAKKTHESIEWASERARKREREREKKSKSGNRSKGINSPKPLYCNFFCVFFSVSFEIRHYRCVAFNLSFFTRKCVFVCVPVFRSGLDVIREAIFCDCVFLLLVVYCAPLACYLLSVSADPDAILFV